MKTKNTIKDVEANSFAEAENNQVMNGQFFSEVAARYEQEGLERIDAGTKYASKIDEFGLPGLLAVVCAATLWGYYTKADIIEQMQNAAPRLSRKFCSQLLDILTGEDPQRHMLKMCPYETHYMMHFT